MLGVLTVRWYALLTLKSPFSGVPTYCNFGVELLTVLPISKVSYIICFFDIKNNCITACMEAAKKTNGRTWKWEPQVSVGAAVVCCPGVPSPPE